MSLFYPDLFVNKLTDISYNLLYSMKIKTVLLDIDDTISPNLLYFVPQNIKDWVEMLKAQSLSLIIITNSSYNRANFFAKRLQIPFIYRAMKPLPFSIYKAINLISGSKSNTIIIGDQIFTDVLAAKLAGIKSILVEPLSKSGSRSLRLKRHLEDLIKNNIRKYNN